VLVQEPGCISLTVEYRVVDIDFQCDIFLASVTIPYQLSKRGGIVMSSDHPGRENIRRIHDSFTVTGPDGRHIVLVQEPGVYSLAFSMQEI
jgi:hypothetical protein